MRKDFWMFMFVLVSSMAVEAKAQANDTPKEPATGTDPEAVDMSTVKGKIKILGDGKGHYVTYVPFAQGDDRQYLFYGDGKAMYMQRPSGGFSSQKPIRENLDTGSRGREPNGRGRTTSTS